jgi:hypothetical protein
MPGGFGLIYVPAKWLGMAAFVQAVHKLHRAMSSGSEQTERIS